MAQTGCIGIHVEANSEGYSRDRAVQAARAIGGKFATIVNDPQLCMMLLDAGITPVHRINRAGLLDDNQDQYGTTRLYVQTAHTEVPDKRALLHWNNEPANNMPRLLREGLIAIDEAVKLGRILVMLSFSYGNPEPADHEYLAPLYRRMAETGMIYACHEGTDLKYSTLADAYPHHIGRFLPIQKKYGFRVLVTEFAASKDAWHGWQTWDSHFAQTCADTVSEVYAPNGVYVTPFTAFKWHEGFDYIDSPALQAAWAETNERYPVNNTVLPPTTGGVSAALTQTPGAYVNIRSAPAPGGADLGDLRVGDKGTIYPNAVQSGWLYFAREDGLQGWVSLQNGAVVFTPVAPPPAGAVTLTEAQAEALDDYLARAIDDMTAARQILKEAAAFSGGF